MDLRTINKKIAQIARNSSALNTLIQETAVGIIEHTMETGDCTAALRLVNAMPKSHRRGLLIEWFATYSPIGMNVSTGKVRLHRPDAKAYRPFDLDGAKANNWYEGASADDEKLPDTSVEAYQKKLFALANSIQKRLDNGEVAAEERDNVIDLAAKVKALAKAEYRRQQAEANAAPVVDPAAADTAAAA